MAENFNINEYDLLNKQLFEDKVNKLRANCVTSLYGWRGLLNVYERYELSRIIGVSLENVNSYLSGKRKRISICTALAILTYLNVNYADRKK